MIAGVRSTLIMTLHLTTNLHRDLIQAINERRVIVIDYEPGLRTIEPHAYGESKEGNGLLRAFQTDGASASGEHIHWKLFRVDRIRSFEVLNEQFPGARPEYRQNDRAMKGGIYAQL
jgi:predicted DNA-binding transcriptional regulator YafY